MHDKAVLSTLPEGAVFRALPVITETRAPILRRTPRCPLRSISGPGQGCRNDDFASGIVRDVRGSRDNDCRSFPGPVGGQERDLFAHPCLPPLTSPGIAPVAENRPTLGFGKI